LGAPPFEIVAAERPRGPFRAIVFDFDDTLSLLRSGWQEVMIAQAMETLAPLSPETPEQELREEIARYIDELTGQPTIRQMMRLAEEGLRRGGAPRPAEEYFAEFTARLAQRKNAREAEIFGGAPAARHMVAGALPLLEMLRERDTTLWIVSGTDDASVQRETRLLGLDRYFGKNVFGAPKGDATFTKGRVFDAIVREMGISGEEIAAFGDGPVELREARRIGGLAVGVVKDAPSEFEGHRRRLIDAGAQAIIPHYLALDEILSLLGMAP
jgi:phosphoglycolate phosphatase